MFGIRKFRVTGISMEPTLAEGGLVLTESASLLFVAPKAGELVVAAHEGLIKIKRIVGASEDKYLLRGDNRSLSSTLEVSKKELLGRVFFIERKA